MLSFFVNDIDCFFMVDWNRYRDYCLYVHGSYIMWVTSFACKNNQTGGENEWIRKRRY